MRSRLSLLASLVLTTAITAQTQGVTNINDYWVTPGGTPGGFSCKAVTLVTPLTMTLRTTTTPGAIFVI